MPDPDAFTEQMRASAPFAAWVEEVAAHFHDADYKNERLPSIKATVASQARAAGLSEDAAESVAGRLVGALMQQASAQAPSRPDPTPEQPLYHPQALAPIPDGAIASFSLVDVIRSPLAGSSELPDAATVVLKDGLQRALITLACVVAADAHRACAVPPGCTEAFRKAMVRPSPGTLWNLLAWAAARSFSDHIAPLCAYLNDVETTGDGWLHALVRLRNQWAHLEAHEADAGLSDTRELLASPPAFLATPTIALQAGGRVAWVGTSGGVLPLRPFVRSHGTDLVLPERFEPPETLVFPEQTDAQMDVRGGSSEPSFADAWHQLRVTDADLRNPRASEIHAKAEQCNAASHEGAAAVDVPSGAPGRLASFPSSDAVGLLAAPAVAAAVSAAVERADPNTATVRLSAQPGRSFPEAIADGLGLYAPPSWSDLCTFQCANTPLLFVVDITSVPPSDVLQHLYALADVHDCCAPAHLRVVLLRSKEALERDQKQLWDRLPEHLETLLHASTMYPAINLPSFVWTPDRCLPWPLRLANRLPFVS